MCVKLGVIRNDVSAIITFGIEMKKLIKISWALALAFSLPSLTSAQDIENQEVVTVTLSANGNLEGHVFTIIEDEKAPIAGKVTLTSGGRTITAKDTDPTGNFSIEDVRPGRYTMVGVAGEYVGDKVIEVTPFEAEGEYTAIPLKVTPAFEPVALEPYAAMPLQTLSSAPAVDSNYFGGLSTGCSTCNACTTCGSSAGFGGGGFSSGGGVASGGFARGGFGRGLNFRRLALIGGTVGLAVGISGPSSPDE